jgi:hypothetical protein
VFTRTDCESLPADLRATVEIALLLDVLEHVPDPGSLVEDVRRILPALRALVITVPARPELWSDLDRRAGHRRRFRLAELSAVVIGAGYLVTDARYLFRLLYPAAWLGRWRPRSMHAPRRPGLHAVLGGLLVADARWLPAWLPGSSALCVARTARAVADRPA